MAMCSAGGRESREAGGPNQLSPGDATAWSFAPEAWTSQPPTEAIRVLLQSMPSLWQRTLCGRKLSACPPVGEACGRAISAERGEHAVPAQTTGHRQARVMCWPHTNVCTHMSVHWFTCAPASQPHSVAHLHAPPLFEMACTPRHTYSGVPHRHVRSSGTGCGGYLPRCGAHAQLPPPHARMMYHPDGSQQPHCRACPGTPAQPSTAQHSTALTWPAPGWCVPAQRRRGAARWRQWPGTPPPQGLRHPPAPARTQAAPAGLQHGSTARHAHARESDMCEPVPRMCGHSCCICKRAGLPSSWRCHCCLRHLPNVVAAHAHADSRWHQPVLPQLRFSRHTHTQCVTHGWMGACAECTRGARMHQTHLVQHAARCGDAQRMWQRQNAILHARFTLAHGDCAQRCF